VNGSLAQYSSPIADSHVSIISIQHDNMHAYNKVCRLVFGQPSVNR